MKALNLIAFVLCVVGLCATVSAHDFLGSCLLGTFALGNFLIWTGLAE